MKTISRKTIDRALLYIRALENLLKKKRDKISSSELADITGSSDVQIRKDISFFGKVGTPRIGYETKKLKDILENFILQNNIVHIALFGVGNLGKAILKYPGFQTDKIKLVAAFDKAKNKISKEVNGIKIYPVEQSWEVIKKVHAEIGIIAVPPQSSQEVANLMVKAGLKGIINFAPSCISVPENIFVKNIDFSIEILSIFSHTQVQK
ncbi:MAG: redox-sensing transcriptional repressor Rex [Candidatus Omnitrophica bacterium]|nr:redox-sensing transcriptional repressor Rex [Candidatus Omnitrophota bacterium]